MNKLLLVLLVSYSVLTLATETEPVTKVLAGKHRSVVHKKRDRYRHPQQTLEFFDVKPNMTVVELWPTDGWYTEILAPYLKNKGKLYVAHFAADTKSPLLRKTRKQFVKKLKANPKIYGEVELTELEPPEYLQIAPDESADRVLTFRNVHNWMSMDQAASVFKAMYKALKHGGILGVVEHRNSNTKPQDLHATSGYVTEDYVIELARNAGFEYLDKSEINANTKDDKNHPEGVWTLPPTLRLKNKNKDKYLDIGESDRMTLKFIKP